LLEEIKSAQKTLSHEKLNASIQMKKKQDELERALLLLSQAHEEKKEALERACECEKIMIEVGEREQELKRELADAKADSVQVNFLCLDSLFLTMRHLTVLTLLCCSKITYQNIGRPCPT